MIKTVIYLGREAFLNESIDTADDLYDLHDLDRHLSEVRNGVKHSR